MVSAGRLTLAGICSGLPTANGANCIGKKPEPMFLIITGTVTALGLPFALAFPRTLLEKLGAVVALVAVAAAIAALALSLRKKS